MLKKKIKHIGAGDRIQFVGYVEQHMLPQYYNKVDCLVVPTISLEFFEEQFGRVLVESMACHTPVIGSTSGAIPHVIGNAGLVFQENDPIQLEQQIRKLGDNPDLLIALGTESRKR